jgi:hypothetical protein
LSCLLGCGAGAPDTEEEVKFGRRVLLAYAERYPGRIDRSAQLPGNVHQRDTAPLSGSQKMIAAAPREREALFRASHRDDSYRKEVHSRSTPGCQVGILSASGHRVTLRCTECRYSHPEALPEVDK